MRLYQGGAIDLNSRSMLGLQTNPCFYGESVLDLDIV